MLMNNHNNINISVAINHHPISIQSVLLDKLSWKPQVEELVTQLSRSCGILFKLKHYTNIPVLTCSFPFLFNLLNT